MSHTFDYTKFFTVWHMSDKKYGVSADTDAWIRAVSKENAAQAVEDERCVPVIPVDEIIHTNEHPFCDDPACPCANDLALIEEQEHHIEDGLLTYGEFVRILHGMQL